MTDQRLFVDAFKASATAFLASASASFELAGAEVIAKEHIDAASQHSLAISKHSEAKKDYKVHHPVGCRHKKMLDIHLLMCQYHKYRAKAISECFNPEDWQFEQSSGFVGYRNTKTGKWIHSDEFNRLSGFMIPE